MIEFKFSCPSCGQHLQVTDAYSGRQINCPACQELILVPQAPGPRTVIPATAAPPIIPVPSGPAAPTGSRAVPAGRRSWVKWIIIASAAGLAVVGAVALVLASGMFSHSGSNPAGMPGKRASGQKDSPGAASARPQSLSASKIVQKVAEQYAALTSYSATGTVISDMDMSKVNAKSLPGADKMPAGGPRAKELQQAMSQPIRTESEFSVKLGRPGYYRIEWKSKTGPTVMKGAAWCAGKGDFLSLAEKNYTRMESRDLALASATGVSGGVAATVPAVFFQSQTGLLDSFKAAKRSGDEIVDGEDCYVLNRGAMGMQVTLWVAKSNFLIKQKQMAFGGKSAMPEMSETQMDEALKNTPHLTPEQAAEAKATMKNMKPMLSQMKGTITETYRNVEINQPVKEEDFNHELPAGAVLSKTLF